ncbi:hypothetical protein AB0M87_07010 [Streptomyces sp. NPDC051320]|uniref:hypothetical protein n=1 Tax=Streptomyces sp. NPDC051320 TaxID=3154644 RepID=UPI00343253C4
MDAKTDESTEADQERRNTEQTAADPEKNGANQEAVIAGTARNPRRRAYVAAGAALAVCAGLVLYGVHGAGGDDAKPASGPSAAVTYRVDGTGTVDISYRAADGSGAADTAVTADAVRLPWQKSVQVPLGQDPVVSIALDGKGGKARCELTVRGRYVRSATASGAYGRAGCQGTLATATLATGTSGAGTSGAGTSGVGTNRATSGG